MASPISVSNNESTVTLKGIESVKECIGYRNPGILKARYLLAVSSHFTSQEDIDNIKTIEPDLLIKEIWGIGDDPSAIKSKRKNLSSVRSTVNSDLKKLYEKGENPEGLKISADNIFIMSDEAKNDLLESFSNSIKADSGVDLNKISDVLNLINDFLSNVDTESEIPEQLGAEDVLDKIKKVLGKISDEILDEEPADIEDSEFEEIDEEELDEIEDDDFEEVDDDEFDEIDDDDFEEVDDDEFDEIDDLESGIPSDSLEDEISESEDNRVLAEQFTSSLSAMDRYYNKYLLIPPGNYLIGSPSPEKYEIKEHLISLPDFFMGKFPITNALFEVFVNKTGYRSTAEKNGYGTVHSGRFSKRTDKQSGQIDTKWRASHNYEVIQGACWYQPEGPGSSLHNKLHHPVVQVSLDDALAFAAWVGKRLPSEEEWEASARTEKGFRYPWGNDWQKNACNTEESGIAETTPVDNYLDFINGYDLSDLLGNILEWTISQIKPPFKTKSEAKFQITKGGSWISDQNISLWSRFIYKAEYSSNVLGFRCITE